MQSRQNLARGPLPHGQEFRNGRSHPNGAGQHRISDGVLVEQGTRRAFIREQFTTYELSKRVGSDPEEYIQRRTIPLIGESQFAVQLISPELGQALFDNLSPANDLSDVVDIDVTVEFRGEYADDRQPFSTGSLVFPIRAFKSSPPVDCINGYERYPPQFDADGNPIPACLYVGQGYGQFAPPPPPSVCVP